MMNMNPDNEGKKLKNFISREEVRKVIIEILTRRSIIFAEALLLFIFLTCDPSTASIYIGKQS